MSQKLHDNERIKIESNFLRGKLVEGINDATTGSFPSDEVQLVKFHGLYQQDDRDRRAERKKLCLGGACGPHQYDPSADGVR